MPVRRSGQTCSRYKGLSPVAAPLRAARRPPVPSRSPFPARPLCLSGARRARAEGGTVKRLAPSDISRRTEISFIHITCPTARKRAATVLTVLLYYRQLTVNSPLRSMLAAKAFLRAASTGRAGGLPAQSKPHVKRVACTSSKAVLDTKRAVLWSFSKGPPAVRAVSPFI